ncbi:hypothetical protein [Sorangium cellulosum]|uniref:hypothetical protein n=1 Tax=Sorangium cellulosum TaxID=56 RepID=UPI0005D13A71|nr:hypothetical protein [Sorangium cellulosum]
MARRPRARAGARPSPPAAAPGEAAALLRWVDAARAALSAPGGSGAKAAPRAAGAPAAPGASGAKAAPAPAPLAPDAAAWLTARYLEESLLLRPLIEPYFVAREVEPRGGREGPDLPALERATPWRSLGAGGRLGLHAPGADVLRIALRPRAYGATRVVVRAGGAVVRELAWRTGARLADAARWREPRWIRVPLPVDARAATVEVVEGEIAVAAGGYPAARVGVVGSAPASPSSSRRSATAPRCSTAPRSATPPAIARRPTPRRRGSSPPPIGPPRRAPRRPRSTSRPGRPCRREDTTSPVRGQGAVRPCRRRCGRSSSPRPSGGRPPPARRSRAQRRPMRRRRPCRQIGRAHV